MPPGVALKFVATELADAWIVEPELHRDERGWFARSFCQREFAERGLSDVVAQCNLSHNHRKGTLRGMHYQLPPSAEAKLVRCTSGAIWDAIVDLRPNSPTHGRWFGVELRAEERRALYVPERFAHGFQTLCDDTEIFYQMSASHAPELARGFRWDDPTIGIRWPMEPTVISQRDRDLGAYAPEADGG